MPVFARATLLIALTIAGPIAGPAAGRADERPAAGPPARAVDTQRPNRRRYCAQAPMLGAWVAARPCRTREEWRRDAIDLLGLR